MLRRAEGTCPLLCCWPASSWTEVKIQFQGLCEQEHPAPGHRPACLTVKNIFENQNHVGWKKRELSSRKYLRGGDRVAHTGTQGVNAPSRASRARAAASWCGVADAVILRAFLSQAF